MTANVQVPSPRGSRNTKQRAVVLDAVRSLHNHPTSADIYDVVHRDHPNVSRATAMISVAIITSMRSAAVAAAFSISRRRGSIPLRVS